MSRRHEWANGTRSSGCMPDRVRRIERCTGPGRVSLHAKWLACEAGLAGSIRHGVRWIVRIPRAVEALTGGGNVGVGEPLVRIVVHAARHLLSRLGRRKVGCARPLVVVPRFVAELEIGDVLLDEDLIEKRLAGDRFGRETMIGAFL